MLSNRTIEPHTLELLRHLMQMQELGNLRLVGGTALALQYGHRTSIDLDLFGYMALENVILVSIRGRKQLTNYTVKLYVQKN